jgi:hypothetical protein
MSLSDTNTDQQAAQQIQAQNQTAATAVPATPIQAQSQTGMNNWESSTMGMPRPVVPTGTQTAPVQPQPPIHEKIFSTVLKTLAGGSNRPIRDASGNPVTDESGNVVMAPASKKSLGASILAGALAGLAQGFTEMPHYGGKGVGYVGANVGTAAEKGLEAGRQFGQQGSREAAQKQADDLKLRQYTVYKMNQEAHTMAFNAWHQDREQNEAIVADAEKLGIANAVRSGIVTDEKGNSIYNPNLDMMDAAALQAHIQKGDVTMDSVIPVGTRAVTEGPDKGKTELLYMALPVHGLMSVTPEMKKEFPNLTQNEIPVYAAVKLFQNRTQGTILDNTFANLSKAQTDAFGKPGDIPAKLDWSDLFKRAQIFSPDEKAQIVGLGSMQSRPDQFVVALQKAGGKFATLGTLLTQQLGIDPTKWAQWEKTENETQELATGAIKDIAMANDILTSKNPRVTEERKDQAQAWIKNNRVLKQSDSDIEEAREQRLAQFKQDIAQQTPSQDNFGGTVGAGLTIKEFNSRYKTFSKDYVEPANRLAKTNMEFNRILADNKMTGAEKVTALLAAVGISGNPLQGKGFRINQATIDEHANARNVYQTALQKANTLSGTGGPITEQQVRDYAAIARGVVHDEYVQAAREARRQGLPVDFLPKGSGQKIDADTVKIYLDAAQGNRDAARKAAQADGWVF